MKKRGLSVLFCCLLLLSLAACQPKKSAVDEAVEAINAIGTVNLGSLEIIEYSEAMYNALSVPERVKVTNKNTLDRARAEYNRLEGMLKDAESAIDAIGTVTLVSGDDIEEAREAYDMIAPYDVSGRLTTSEKILTSAEAKLKKQETEAEELLVKTQELFDSGRYSEVEPLIAPEIEMLDAYGIAGDYGTLAVKALCAYSQEQYNSQNYMDAVNLLMKAMDYEAYCDSTTYARISKQISDYSVGMSKFTPKNGDIIARTQKPGRNNIKINAGSSDTLVKVERLDDPEKYVLVYVKANKSVTVYLLNGDYRVKYTTGPLWIDEANMFGDFATFVEMEGVAHMAGFSVTKNKVTTQKWGAYVADLTLGYGKEFGYQNITPDAF